MYLLDTDILIYSLKGHGVVCENLRAHRVDPLAVSVVSLLELYYGAHKSRNVESNLAKVRSIEAAFQVIPLAPESAATFGSLRAGMEAKGLRLDDFDLCLAATSLAHNLVLVTNNVRHFRRVEGLRLENWAVPRAPGQPLSP